MLFAQGFCFQILWKQRTLPPPIPNQVPLALDCGNKNTCYTSSSWDSLKRKHQRALNTQTAQSWSYPAIKHVHNYSEEAERRAWMCTGSAAPESWQKMVNLCWPGHAGAESKKGQQEMETEAVLGIRRAIQEVDQALEGGETNQGNLGWILTPGPIDQAAWICGCWSK